MGVSDKSKKFWDTVGTVIASIIGVALFYLWHIVICRGFFFPQ